jgi:putative heme degradation protein
MTEHLSITTMVCNEYQQLLEQSKRARDVWDERRIEICRSRLVAKEIGDELLRLQANYARAYTRLRKHVSTCGRCEPVSKIA